MKPIILGYAGLALHYTTLLAINNQSHTHSYYLTLYNQINLVGKNRFRFVVKLYKIFYIVKMYNLWKGIKKQGKHRLLRLCLTRKISDVPTIKSICSLPSEVLEHVFKFLPKKDMLSVVLVCRWWREVGERPQFWSSCKIVVSRRGELDMLRSRRFQFLQNIIVGGYWWETKELEELFRCLLMLPKLKTLYTLLHVNVGSVSPGLIAKIIQNMELVQLPWLVQAQVEAVLRNSSNKLKSLFIPDSRVEHVDAELLTSAIYKLEEVNMHGCHLTRHQVEDMFDKISRNANVKRFCLSYNDLSTIDPGTLATVARDLEGLHIEETQLTFPQVETIFNELLISTNLTDLNISSNFLSTILPMTLATAITKVQVVNVANCALTEEQVQAVFETMNEEMCLKELNIAWNNLLTLDANILATGVNKLRSLDISRTNVTVTQVDQIFREAAKGTHLRTLSHDQELVGQINPQILAEALPRMRD